MRIFKLDGVNIVLTSPYQFINLAVNCGLLIGAYFCFATFRLPPGSFPQTGPENPGIPPPHPALPD